MSRISRHEIHGLKFPDMLEQRGHVFTVKPKTVFHEDTVLSRLCKISQKSLSNDFFYDWFSNKNNRIFLRKNLLQANNREILKYPSWNDYPSVDLDLNQIDLTCFTKTFEWYVADLLLRELKFVSSGFGIKLEGSPQGGDFDVIGFTINELVYIETKTGTPRNLDIDDFYNFVSRAKFLSSTISAMYIDFDGISQHFNYQDFLKAIGEDRLYEISCKRTGAKLYRPAVSRFYILENFKSSGNVVNNLRFLFQTHYSLEAILRSQLGIDPKDLSKDLFEVRKIL